MAEFFKDPLALYAAFAVLGLWPAMEIFRRAGFARWWAFFIFVPYIGNVICAGFLALKPWPNKQGA